MTSLLLPVMIQARRPSASPRLQSRRYQRRRSRVNVNLSVIYYSKWTSKSELVIIQTADEGRAFRDASMSLSALPATRQSDIPALTPAEAGARFSGLS